MPVPHSEEVDEASLMLNARTVKFELVVLIIIYVGGGRNSCLTCLL